MHGVAVDAGTGLAEAIRKARGEAARQTDLLDFKRAVLTALGTHASTVLLDAECGPQLLDRYPSGCEPMLALEQDVYHISDSDRITKLPHDLSVADFPGLGVRKLKFFMYYAPDDDDSLNSKKRAIIRDIGAACHAHDVSFLMEPLVYHPRTDAGTAQYAQIKPDLVRRVVEIFSDPVFGIDTLKIEVPVDLGFVEGFGQPQRTRAQALREFENISLAARGLPIVYLSAGVPFSWFEASLHMAAECDTDFSGFMCGRAIWSDAIEVYGKHGEGAVVDWLAVEGRRRFDRLVAALER